MTASLLLLVSDPHFGAERPEVCQALLALTRQLQPDIVVWSGDLTQRATAAQFAAARNFVQALAEALPVSAQLVLPGNHDIPLYALHERLFFPFKRYANRFGAALEPRLDVPGWQLTAVNTVRRWRHRRGALSQRQIDQVTQRLRQAPPGAWRVVVSHHPLWVDEAADQAQRPWRHAQALRVWTDNGLDVLLAGHTHRSFMAALPGGRAWQVQAGTAVSRRTRDGAANTVSLLIQHADGRRQAARWEFETWSQRFIEVERRQLDGA